jgi:hypothetical protein
MFLGECLDHSLKVAKLDKTKSFFDLMTKVLMNTDVAAELPRLLGPQLVTDTIGRIVAIIQAREIKEVSARDEDVVL